MDHKEIEKYRLELKTLKKEKSSSFKKIECPSCAAAIKSADLNIQDKVAKCSSCDVVFSFEKDLVELGRNDKPTQELIRPEGIELFHFRDELEISIQQPVTTAEGVLGGLLPIFPILFTLAYFANPAKIHLAVVAVAWIVGMLPMLNLIFRRKQKIYINIDDKYLTVQQRPRKLRKDLNFETQDINQIYIKSAHHKFFLYAIIDTPNGQKHVRLISEMTSISKIKYLEQEIERFLNIENRSVPEEHK